jgi:hypothetical protein
MWGLIRIESACLDARHEGECLDTPPSPSLTKGEKIGPELIDV